MQVSPVTASYGVPQITTATLRDDLKKIQHFVETSLAVLNKKEKPAPLQEQQGNTYNIFYYHEQPSAFASFCNIFSAPRTWSLFTFNDNSTYVNGRTVEPVTRENDNKKKKETSTVALILKGLFAVAVGAYAASKLAKNENEKQKSINIELTINNYSTHIAVISGFKQLDLTSLNEVDAHAHELIRTYQKQRENHNIINKVLLVSSAILLVGLFGENPVAYLARKVGFLGILGCGLGMVYQSIRDDGIRHELTSLSNMLLTHDIVNANESLDQADMPPANPPAQVPYDVPPPPDYAEINN